tara:strand:- start:33 stop:290 length:258 start_codon:yes stop_codon:yes gene_type:complete
MELNTYQKLLILILLIFAITATVINYITSYRSAFEADQACHSLKWKNYQDSEVFGCDHDLETNQWILYETSNNHSPAKIMKRFRY